MVIPHAAPVDDSSPHRTRRVGSSARRRYSLALVNLRAKVEATIPTPTAMGILVVRLLSVNSPILLAFSLLYLVQCSGPLQRGPRLVHSSGRGAATTKI